MACINHYVSNLFSDMSHFCHAWLTLPIAYLPHRIITLHNLKTDIVGISVIIAACHQNNIRMPFGTLVTRIARHSPERNEKLMINRWSINGLLDTRFSCRRAQLGTVEFRTEPRETYIMHYLSRQLYRRWENGRVVILRWLPRGARRGWV